MSLHYNRCLQLGILLQVIILFSCTGVKDQSFSFVQMCDTQLGMGGYKHDVWSFEQAVKQINEQNPDFVVICGDLVHHATDSSFADFKRIMSGFNMPCYPAPGNHDVGNVPTDTSLNYYRNVIGDDYYQFSHKDYSFLVTNTQLWKVDVEKESALHHNWFKSTIDSLGKNDAKIFVLGHYPIFIKSPDEEDKYFNLPIGKRSEILDLLTRNKAIAYLSGHKHETIINDYENIQFVSGETTSRNFDKRPLGYRLWNVTADSVWNNFVPLDTTTMNTALNSIE